MQEDFFKMNGIDLPSIEQADASENPTAVCKFTNGNWNWFVIGGDELKDGDYYLYVLVDGIEKELGMATLKQIIDAGAVLDKEFAPIGVFDIFEDFDLRKKGGIYGKAE